MTELRETTRGTDGDRRWFYGRGGQTYWRLLAGLLAGAIIGHASLGFGQTRNGFDLRGASVPVAAIESGGPPRDGIPAIDRPKFVSARDATFLTPGDRVLGLVRHGVAKAYPVRIMNWHEIVNDRFGSEKIVVTFCPLCGTGMAFESQIGGRALDFGVSGLLYNSDVLLYDRQTESLWSQILGKAISGAFQGTALRAVPLAHTTWSDWQQRHPATRVLSMETGHARNYGRDPYAEYLRSEELMFSVAAESRRYHPKESVIGIELHGHTKAYPFVELAKAVSPLRDRIGDSPVLVHFDVTQRTGAVFDANGHELPSVIGFWFAWYAFHPNGEVFAAPSTKLESSR